MSNKYKYQMLSRLQIDCEYYLGCGNRCNKHLYHKTPENHIAEMKTLYNSFKASERPEWLTMEKIKQYEKQMMKDNLKVIEIIKGKLDTLIKYQSKSGVKTNLFFKNDLSFILVGDCQKQHTSHFFKMKHAISKVRKLLTA